MTSLTGKPPKDFYRDLLQVSNGNKGVDDTLRPVEDGEGTPSALQVSTNAARLAGLLDFAGTGHGGIRLNNLTTAQRDALAAGRGVTIFNTTTNRVETFNGTDWVAGGLADLPISSAPLTGAESLVLTQGGATFRVSLAALAAYLADNPAVPANAFATGNGTVVADGSGSIIVFN